MKSSSLSLAMNLQWLFPSTFLQENKLGNQHAEKIGLRKYPCPNKNAILSYNNRRIIVNRRQNVYILLFRSFYNNVQRQNYLLHILEFYYPFIQFFFEEEIIKYSARLIKTIIVKKSNPLTMEWKICSSNHMTYLWECYLKIHTTKN